jgi:hypothetical protein
MHETTQQNASLVEEAAAAAASLHAQAEALFDAMRVFKLEEQAAEPPVTQAQPPAPSVRSAPVRALAHAA